MRSLALAAFAAASLFASVEAHAQAQQNFAMVNRSGAQIDEVYVSASNRDSWGRDILGDGVMPSGTRRNITFPRGTRACEFDIRVVFANGQRRETRGVDLCQVSTVTVTPSGRFATE
ncbi:hypothetical protein E8L99_16235 [Phreatobacter aquaticus]|uniref:Tat pathway signal protein n=1 Tax=Phreatobacter aquaticus TaxID=2570229 RepID=A0A4D7QJE6_9HYPH|nr:hypothetical protein [Phreatobacter aquaticus]QCK87195.1 hypothetical protein E8L99_16235 [Phreatobacter aquaticus]